MSDETFESFDIRDTPDSWFDTIQREATEFLEKTSIYPTGLAIVIIQVIFQNFVYACLAPKNRDRFLAVVFDTFIQQFDQWDEEDQEADDTDA